MTGSGTEVTQRVANLENRKPASASAQPVWLPAAESRGATWAGQTVAYRLDILTRFPQQKNYQQENQTLLNIQELVIDDMKFK